MSAATESGPRDARELRAGEIDAAARAGHSAHARLSATAIANASAARGESNTKGSPAARPIARESGHETARLTASDGAANDLLGRSVAVSGDGATVVAGAYQKSVGGSYFQGAAYVFVRPTPGWRTTGTTGACRAVSRCWCGGSTV